MRLVRFFFTLFAATLVCGSTACNSSPPAKPAASKSRPAKPAVASSTSAVEIEAPEEQTVAVADKKAEAAAAAPAGAALADETPAVLYAPKVALTAGHAATSLVKVGDAFPKLALTDLEGKPAELSTLMGAKLTVVLFWSDKLLYSREQFRRFGPEVAARYAHLGVKAVAINVGESAEVVKKEASELKVQFPCLVDPEKKAFAQVAKDGLPRVFVLNAQGKVLWFDLEYSSITRRELHNAVHYYTQSAAPAKID